MIEYGEGEISEEPVGLFSCPKDVSSMLLRNIGKHLADNTASYLGTVTAVRTSNL
jgi:hypothetical protein